MTDPYMEKAREAAIKYCGENHGSLFREGGGCQMCHLRTEAIALALREAVEEEREAIAQMHDRHDGPIFRVMAREIRSRSNKEGR